MTMTIVSFFLFLPDDIIDNIILKYGIMSRYDFINLVSINRQIYQKFEVKIHEMYHECINEVETNWNELAPTARMVAKEKRKEYKSECGWEVTMNEQFTCSINPKKIHSISVTYVHNPRDVDILAWSENGKQHGYTFY